MLWFLLQKSVLNSCCSLIREFLLWSARRELGWRSSPSTLLTVGYKVCLYLSELLGAQGNTGLCSQCRICAVCSWLIAAEWESHSPLLLQQGRRLLEGEFLGSVSSEVSVAPTRC